ncbi:hypothetical protein AAVH_29509 [Aphelenchoides avenae]|nr:hypothetical protein AAVH_29509 [Aphelenchus avenae]
MAQQSREHDTLTLIIDNATEYFKTARGWSDHKRTGNVTLCGSEWYLMADRVTKDGVAWLDVGICCDRATNDAYWCKGTFIIRIRSSGPDDFTRRRCIELCDEIGELITIEVS